MSALPLRVKAGYGTAEAGIAAVEFFARVYLLKLYTDELGLRASLAGLVLAVAVLWDAVTDPLMGEVSDRTRSPWGRRRPWIALGALAAAGSFVALFRPPALGGQWSLAAWLLGTYLALNTALTLLAVPHAALGGDLTREPRARNEIFGWRFLFGNLGFLVGVLAPAAFAGGGRGAAAGAPILAGAVILAVLPTLLVTRGLDRPGRVQGRRRFFPSLGAVLGCRPFRPLLGAYFLGSTALTVNSALALFYYEHRLELTERQVFLGVLLPFALVIAVSIGGWVFASRWLGKRTTAFTGVFALGLGTALAYPLLPPGELLGPVICAVVGGLLVGSVFLLDAAVADVVDLDRAVSGASREGLYFGLWRMASKVARAGGLLLAGLLLDAVGFVPDADAQSPGARRGLALAFGPGVGALFVAAAFVWLRVPLTEALQVRVRRVLARRERHRHTRRNSG